VLGLDRAASLGEIKRAYRRLARRYHPNLNPGDREAAAQFERIAEAYQILSDPVRRQQYDAGDQGRSQSGSTRSAGFEGFDFSVSVTGAAAPTFGDLFSDVWRVAAARARETTEPVRGADLHLTPTLPFELALRGGEWPVTVTRQEPCRRCGGTGLGTTTDRQCGQCAGSGVLRAARGHMVFSRPCGRCGGTGRQTVGVRCPACAGQQRELHTEALTIEIPAGIADGAEILVPGRGHAGWYGGPPGDLRVTVHVGSHPTFRREGRDLHIIVPIGVHEAGLGAKIEVPTLEGPARLRIPPGTQSGQRFRLRERGVPSPRRAPGDLVVEVQVVLPGALDDRAKALLLELGRLYRDDVRKALWASTPAAGAERQRREPGP